MDYCTNCETLEGRWRDPTPEERIENDLPNNDFETQTCCECGEVGSHAEIKEHDSGDMER